MSTYELFDLRREPVSPVSALKAELVSQAKFPSRRRAEVTIFEYLEEFYNPSS